MLGLFLANEDGPFRADEDAFLFNMLERERAAKLPPVLQDLAEGCVF